LLLLTSYYFGWRVTGRIDTLSWIDTRSLEGRSLHITDLKVYLESICDRNISFEIENITIESKQNTSHEKLDGPAVSALRRAIVEVKQRGG
jgi:hypothetical protein